MKIMNLKERNEDAVSPVIGVMLMLVVTIVIAAVVAAFAGGLGSDVEMAPTAALDISAKTSGTVTITSLSGEILIPNEITVKASKADGTALGEAKLSDASGIGTSFAPGSTATIQLKKGDANAVLSDIVTITVLANGKHIVAKKDVLVR